MNQMKKSYAKPELKLHGAVEAVTGFGGAHDVFGGGFLSRCDKTKAKDHGPADKAS